MYTRLDADGSDAVLPKQDSVCDLDVLPLAVAYMSSRFFIDWFCGAMLARPKNRQISTVRLNCTSSLTWLTGITNSSAQVPISLLARHLAFTCLPAILTCEGRDAIQKISSACVEH